MLAQAVEWLKGGFHNVNATIEENAQRNLAAVERAKAITMIADMDYEDYLNEMKGIQEWLTNQE